MTSTRFRPRLPPPPPSPALLADLRPLAARKVVLERRDHPRQAQREWFADILTVAKRHEVSVATACGLAGQLAASLAGANTPPPLPSSVAG
jgi:hypothetical protein